MSLDEQLKYFSSLLKGLTFNSRVHITDLTIAAEKNLDKADFIVELVEQRLKNTLPEYKLFIFYLVDSICKNIGSPYNVLFSKNLVEAYQKTYQLVNDEVRQKLINLFKTWIHARTKIGVPLFPREVIESIEQFIIKVTKRPSITVIPTTILLTPEKIMIEIDSLIDYINKLDRIRDKNTNERQLKLEYLNKLGNDIKQYGINESYQIKDLQEKLLEIRKGLDYHGFLQKSDPKLVFKLNDVTNTKQQPKPRIRFANEVQTSGGCDTQRSTSATIEQVPKKDEKTHNIKVPTPLDISLSDLTKSINETQTFTDLVENFGIPRDNTYSFKKNQATSKDLDVVPDQPQKKVPVKEEALAEAPLTDLSQNIFGINVEKFHSRLLNIVPSTNIQSSYTTKNTEHTEDARGKLEDFNEFQHPSTRAGSIHKEDSCDPSALFKPEEPTEDVRVKAEPQAALDIPTVKQEYEGYGFNAKSPMSIKRPMDMLEMSGKKHKREKI